MSWRLVLAAQDRAGDAHTTEVDGLGELQTTVPALEGTHTILICIADGGGGSLGQDLGGVNVNTGVLLEVTACKAGNQKAIQQGAGLVSAWNLSLYAHAGAPRLAMSMAIGQCNLQ